MTPYEALSKAVDVIGGQTAVAHACGGKIKQQHVFNWLRRDKRLPAKYALKIQKATQDKGDMVSATDLCPDAFPADLMPDYNKTDSAA